jgi:hypothetical protein
MMLNAMLSVLLAANPGHTVLVEAEQFAECGGWVRDCQFMDQMGSPYLLAHGLGVPVADASTTVTFPAAGSYRVLVRTRDWVAPWNAPGSPGRFQLLIDGQPLQTVFGTRGADWHWHDGGSVQITHDSATVTLHDLTGFEGRCDAILFTTDPEFTPPNSDPEMAAWRRELLGIPAMPEQVGQFDLVVVGGGIAGTCAAVSAARLGLDVALVQDRPVLGGNNSSEVRVWLQGARNKEPYPRVGDIVAELEQQRSAHYGPDNTADLYEDDKKLDLVAAEEKLRLLLNCRVNAVQTQGERIVAVIGQDTVTGRRYRLDGRWFADCTGDGAVGFLAGAHYEMTLPGHMGRCNLWNVIETDRPVPFPRCEWALDLSDKPFPGRRVGPSAVLSLGGWYWESGFDHNPFDRSEYIRDWNFRAMYGAWDALKNTEGVYPNHQLNWAAYVAGKRESRRLLGDVILQKSDLIDSKPYPDGCVPTGWKIDLHLPDPRYVQGFEGDGFIAKADFTDYPRPYWIPYRCLYSRNIENLFMAGRDISVTHEALGAVRVMRTGGCMGEIVGMAASLCKTRDGNPRDVYADHLAELQELMRRGVGRPLEPPRPVNVGRNVAPAAVVATSGDKDAATWPPDLVRDGRVDLRRNELRWLSAVGVPNWIEFRWPEAQTIAAARIVSGYNTGGDVIAPIEAFSLQTFAGDSWQDIEETATESNQLIDWQTRFAPVTTDRVRLNVTAVHSDISRIWEIELYEPAAD